MFRRKVLPQSSGSNFKREAADTFENSGDVYQNIRHHTTEDPYISKTFMHKNLASVNIFVMKCIIKSSMQKANWIGHNLHRNCHLQHVMEGEI